MMISKKYKWQGDPVKVRFGYCFVKTNKEKPICWYNYECSIKHEDNALIPAIQITTYDNEVFVIANHFGIGINKILKGGWPNATHFSLPKLNFTESNMHAFVIKEFNEIEYSIHESERIKWQKENYPVEFEKLQSLKRMIK